MTKATGLHPSRASRAVGQAGPHVGAQKAGGGRHPTSHAGLPGAGCPGREHVSFTWKASPLLTNRSRTWTLSVAHTKAPSTPATALTVPGKLRDQTPSLSHSRPPGQIGGSGVCGHRDRCTARLHTLTGLCFVVSAQKRRYRDLNSDADLPWEASWYPQTSLTVPPAHQLTLNPRRASTFPTALKLPLSSTATHLPRDRPIGTASGLSCPLGTWHSHRAHCRCSY